MQVEALRLDGPAGPLSAELTRPEGARAVLVLAHAPPPACGTSPHHQGSSSMVRMMWPTMP